LAEELEVVDVLQDTIERRARVARRAGLREQLAHQDFVDDEAGELRLLGQVVARRQRQREYILSGGELGIRVPNRLVGITRQHRDDIAASGLEERVEVLDR